MATFVTFVEFQRFIVESQGNTLGLFQILVNK